MESLHLAGNLNPASFKAYLVWGFGVALVFFPVYHLCNWFTDQRQIVYTLYLNAELQIPFIPAFFWAYVSVYVLVLLPPFLLNPAQLASLGKQLIAAILIAGLVFLLLPSQLGFPRIAPEDPFYAVLYRVMFAVDLPHNMVPSLHIALSAILVLSYSHATFSVPQRIVWASWFTLITLSTLFVHQHHLLDIITGIALAIIVRRIPLCQVNN